MKNEEELQSHAPDLRPTWAEIDMDALASNFRCVQKLVGDDVQIMCIVKADAYGHGAIACARRLEREGAAWFGVACPEEAFELRAAGIAQPILSLGGFWRGQEAALLQQKVTPVICRPDMAESLNAAAQAAGVVADIHVEIDTGINRSGVRFADASAFAEKLRAFKHLRVEGLMTHFAAADDPAQVGFTREQIKLYDEALTAFRAHGHTPTYRDLANSPATFAYPNARGNLIRPGGLLYGLWRDVLPPQDVEPELRAVMSLHSRIALLKTIHKGETTGYGRTFTAKRETKVATLPIGYHDGIPRALSNRGRVIVRGRFAPLIGRVSMDLTLIDVTDILDVALDDMVTFIGAEGDLQITAEDVARDADTISYEITCGIGARVPRKSLESEVWSQNRIQNSKLEIQN